MSPPSFTPGTEEMALLCVLYKHQETPQPVTTLDSTGVRTFAGTDSIVHTRSLLTDLRVIGSRRLGGWQYKKKYLLI